MGSWRREVMGSDLLSSVPSKRGMGQTFWRLFLRNGSKWGQVRNGVRASSTEVASVRVTTPSTRSRRPHLAPALSRHAVAQRHRYALVHQDAWSRGSVGGSVPRDVTSDAWGGITQLMQRYALQVVIVASLFWGCHRATFEGGKLRDLGCSSRPRFIATLGRLPAATSSSGTYTFRNFPARVASLVLILPDLPDAESVRRSDSRITVRLADPGGHVVCMAEGKPSSSLDSARWYVSSGRGGRADQLVHVGCSDVVMNMCSPCSAHVEIAGVTAFPAVYVAVIGGGSELP